MTDVMVLSLVKARLNRLPSDTTLDMYLQHRIRAAREQLAGNGIVLDDASADDTMLLVDMVVWEYHNRDNPNGMPEWLRLRRRERWFRQKRTGDAGDT